MKRRVRVFLLVWTELMTVFIFGVLSMGNQPSDDTIESNVMMIQSTSETETESGTSLAVSIDEADTSSSTVTCSEESYQSYVQTESVDSEGLESYYQEYGYRILANTIRPHTSEVDDDAQINSILKLIDNRYMSEKGHLFIEEFEPFNCEYERTEDSDYYLCTTDGTRWYYGGIAVKSEFPSDMWTNVSYFKEYGISVEESIPGTTVIDKRIVDEIKKQIVADTYEEIKKMVSEKKKKLSEKQLTSLAIISWDYGSVCSNMPGFFDAYFRYGNSSSLKECYSARNGSYPFVEDPELWKMFNEEE